MVIAETSIFTQCITQILDDDAYSKLQHYLAMYPDAGALIRNTGGIRKVRWALPGSGKSGGIRVIYFWRRSHDQIIMLLAYKKSRQENLTDDQKKTLKQIVSTW